ncbi:Alpha-1,3-mannosyltransferase [Penicillium ucsense]|uniref:Alpha-1,3-mannosyltransferase n=1 Tax=Penicillium ucsense TaxID=2839758 RepID=A0A8J8W3Y1_9EURO|nr:Alpha-1,3-mannosyltransferase [Penicillium ucsense]KAF7737399.1 Alpha-1,3-mannosyltransferase [Penicillium ucsense]
MKNPLTSYSRTIRRALLRHRIIRIGLVILILWNLVDLHFILRLVAETDAVYRDQPRQTERIYIAMVNWNNEYLLRNHLSKAITELSWRLRPENIYISIYESGSYDNTKGALVELDAELEQLRVPRNITLSYVSHADEIAAPPDGEGWVVTPRGKKELRRIPYLSRVRNHSLESLRKLAKQGIHFDKILFLNDVVFTSNDVLELLDTNHGDYAAACSLDFQKPPFYYDTFALRDSHGHEAVTPTWPFFRDASSRRAMKQLQPVPVKSCWNGMVAMAAAPFLASPPLRFRGIPDSLASYHLEASECCLIHADNPLSKDHGIYLNPRVRVGYTTAAYVAVNPTLNWLTPRSVLQGLWWNRIRRWTTFSYFKESAIRKKIAQWARWSPDRREVGEFCVVDEMQILDVRGWYHV